MSYYTQREIMTIRQQAREALIRAGHKPGSVRTHAGIVYGVEVETGADCQGCEFTFIKRWLDANRGLLPAKREVRSAKALQPRPQWDINVERARKAQPRLWTPSGVGNGAEHQHCYGRGS